MPHKAIKKRSVDITELIRALSEFFSQLPKQGKSASGSIGQAILQSPQRMKQIAQNLSESAEIGNLIPQLLNTINAPQRLMDEMRGVSYNTRTPRGGKGNTTESKVLPSQLPYDEKPYDPIGIGSLTIPSRTTFRNPFFREGYLENPANQTSYFGNKDSQLRDVEYFLRNLATDPRSSWARNALIGTLGGLGYAAYKNEPQEQKPYTYDIGANSPEYMQYLGNRRIPSKQTNPYVYQSMDTDYLNRPSKQPYKNFSEVKKQYLNALYADQGVMQTQVENLLKDYYKDITYAKFKQILSENPEMSQSEAMNVASNQIIPIAHEAYKYASPYFEKPNSAAIHQAMSDLNSQRLENYLNTQKEIYRANILGGRSDDQLTEIEKEKLNGIQSMLRQTYVDHYNNEQYLKDLSTVVSNQVMPKVAQVINETYKQRLYKPEQKKVKREQDKYLPADKQEELDARKKEWYRTTPGINTIANFVSPIDETEYDKFKIPYFIPASELDKQIMSRSLTTRLTPERFLNTITPKSVKEDFDAVTQKPLFKRASKKQPHDIIQKSLAPKYQPISKNKYLKEK